MIQLFWREPSFIEEALEPNRSAPKSSTAASRWRPTSRPVRQGRLKGAADADLLRRSVFKVISKGRFQFKAGSKYSHMAQARARLMSPVPLNRSR